jgi:hypothetical protein
MKSGTAAGKPENIKRSDKESQNIVIMERHSVRIKKYMVGVL